MTEFIILTADQASAVTGETSPGFALQPVLLADGVTYVLPAAVLSDPGYSSQWDVLKNFPQRAIADDEWVTPADL